MTLSGRIKTPVAIAPAGATEKQTIDAIIFKEIKNQSAKDSTEEYDAWIMNQATLTKSEFENRFDPDFVSDIVPGNMISKEYIVLETIVFVREICNFLPQPNLEALQEYNKIETHNRNLPPVQPPKKKNLKKVPEKLKKTVTTALTRIERFPKAYKAYETTPTIGHMTKHQVRFQRQFDYSAGKLL